MYETGLLLLFPYIALLLLPLSFFLGVVAPSFSLAGFMSEAVRRGSLSFSWRRCHGLLLLRRLVCTRQACCLFAHVALLLLPLSFFLRVRAPSLSLGRFMNSKLLDVARIVHSRINSSSCVLASLALIVILIVYEFHPPSCVLTPQVLEALRMLLSQALLLLCHLDNDLVIIIYILQK